jgi:hypothetical protein
MQILIYSDDGALVFDTNGSDLSSVPSAVSPLTSNDVLLISQNGKLRSLPSTTLDPTNFLLALPPANTPYNANDKILVVQNSKLNLGSIPATATSFDISALPIASVPYNASDFFLLGDGKGTVVKVSGQQLLDFISNNFSLNSQPSSSSSSSSSSSNLKVITSTYTAKNLDRLGCDTRYGGFDINLPSNPQAGYEIEIFAIGGDNNYVNILSAQWQYSYIVNYFIGNNFHGGKMIFNGDFWIPIPGVGDGTTHGFGIVIEGDD